MRNVRLSTFRANIAGNRLKQADISSFTVSLSVLLDECLKDAKDGNTHEIVVITRKGAFMAERLVFETVSRLSIQHHLILSCL